VRKCDAGLVHSGLALERSCERLVHRWITNLFLKVLEIEIEPVSEEVENAVPRMVKHNACIEKPKGVGHAHGLQATRDNMCQLGMEPALTSSPKKPRSV